MKTVIVIYIFVFVLVVKAKVETGYFWVDYVEGSFPSNAYMIHGGVPEYIGQIHEENVGLSPVPIRIKNHTVVFSTNNRKVEEHSGIKILCSQYAQFFLWMKIDSWYPMTNLVPGGVASNRKIYIGKILHDGKSILGKVENGILQISIHGKTENINKNFYVLIYEDMCETGIDSCTQQLANQECDCSECYYVDPV